MNFDQFFEALERHPVGIALVGIIVSTAMAFLAIFSDHIRNWIYRPKLSCTLFPNPPDCHKTKIKVNETQDTSCYYLRLRITNHGSVDAFNIRAFLSSVSRMDSTSKVFTPLNYFLPQNLKWSFSGVIALDKLPKKTYRHLDLGKLIPYNHGMHQLLPLIERDSFMKPNLFILDTEQFPLNGGSILAPGEYRVEIKLSADNVSTQTVLFQFTVFPKWDEDESEALKRFHMT